MCGNAVSAHVHVVANERTSRADDCLKPALGEKLPDRGGPNRMVKEPSITSRIS